MFGQRGHVSARAGRRGARTRTLPAVVEPLDRRELMSVSVPAGYVQVTTLSLNAVTLAAQTFSVTAGQDYFFRATGTHVLAQQPYTRYADAGSYQSNATTWTDVTILHVRNGSTELVNWGTHAADHEYGASYSPASNLTLTAVITDPYPQDNIGSLDLEVYQRAALQSMTAAESGGGSASATASTGTAASLAVTPDGSGNATVNLSGTFAPDTTAARDKLAWSAYNAAGTVLAYDTFDAGGDSVTFSFPTSYETYTIRAGLDANGNGRFDYGTETVSRTITVTKAIAQLAPAYPNDPGSSTSNRLSVSAGGSATYRYVVTTINGAPASASLSFSSAGGITASATLVDDGLYEVTVSAASGVSGGNYTVSVTDPTDPRVTTMSIYIHV